MKAWFAVVAGVLLLSSSNLARSADDPTLPRRKIPKHAAMMATSTDRGRGAFNVVVGSDIKITPYGEVIVPPTTIISVDDRITAVPPGRQPDKIRPAAPLDLSTAPIDPGKAPPPSVPPPP